MKEKDIFLVGNALAFNATRFSQKKCLIYGGRNFTFQELNERVNRLASTLLLKGIRKGDSVGYALINSNETIEVLYACLKIGAVAVPLNVRLTSNDIKWALNHTKCKILFFSEHLSSCINNIKNELATVDLMVIVGSDCLPWASNYDEFCIDGNIDEPQVEISCEDIALYKFTGGTTGKAKAAIHTQYNLMVTSVIAQLSSSYNDPSSTAIYQLPLYHMSGLVKTLSLLSAGGTIILLSSTVPEEILDLIEKEKVTYAILMPPQAWNRILEVPDINKRNLSSLKTIATSGGSSSLSTYKALFDLMPNVELFYGWGQTETCVLGTALIITKELFESNDERLNSVGVEHPYLRIRIVDENGQNLPDGEKGEAWVQYPGNFLGYLNNPEMTEENLHGRWVKTGDIFYKKDGYHYMVDRKKDMIKTGGENVFCEEVESVLRMHPAIERVAVIGVPDSTFGEGILGVVQLNTNASATRQNIIEFCQERLPSYKKPRGIVFVEEFPLSDVGKIQKYVLRETYNGFFENPKQYPRD